MSASNWAICPSCSKYFPSLLGREEYSFREDYKIYGAETGIITVDYSGHCENCKTGLDFKYEIPIKLDVLDVTSQTRDNIPHI